MSGGSMNYAYSKVLEAADETWDKEIQELLIDLGHVLNEEEWYRSADSGREEYETALSNFKKKWLSGDEQREKRLKKYIDEQLFAVKRELYQLIGIKADSERGS